MRIFNYTVKIITLACGIFATTAAFPAFANPETLGFITLSDIHLKVYDNPGMVINPTYVDDDNLLDKKTFNKFLVDPNDSIGHEIQTQIPDTQFAIVLGDSAGHTASESNRTTYLRTALTELKTQLKLPIFFVMGNNDSLVKNYGLFTQKNITTAVAPVPQGAGWNDVFLSTGETCHNGYPCLYQEKKADGEGYYAAYLKPGLKFIGLNTILFAAKSEASHETDPKELAWLDEQLKDSYTKHESVLIGMHIPPDGNWDSTVNLHYGMNYKNKFFNILLHYPDTVIGMLAGHTHNENFKALAFQYKDATGNKKNDLIPVLYTAGLSALSGNAPSFRYFSLIKKDEHSKWAIKDITTYSFRQAKPTPENSHPPITLAKYYQFDDTYCPGVADITVNDCMKSHVTNFYKTSGHLSFDIAFKNAVKKVGKYAGNPNYVGSESYIELLYLQETKPRPEEPPVTP